MDICHKECSGESIATIGIRITLVQSTDTHPAH